MTLHHNTARAQMRHADRYLITRDQRFSLLHLANAHDWDLREAKRLVDMIFAEGEVRRSAFTRAKRVIAGRQTLRSA